MLDGTEALRQVELFDVWPEELLSSSFEYAVENVLTVKERFVLEMRVQNKSWKYIAKVLKVGSGTARKYKGIIVQKLTHGMSLRVDNYPYQHFKMKKAK